MSTMNNYEIYISKLILKRQENCANHFQTRQITHHHTCNLSILRKEIRKWSAFRYHEVKICVRCRAQDLKKSKAHNSAQVITAAARPGSLFLNTAKHDFKALIRRKQVFYSFPQIYRIRTTPSPKFMT